MKTVADGSRVPPSLEYALGVHIAGTCLVLYFQSIFEYAVILRKLCGAQHDAQSKQASKLLLAVLQFGGCSVVARIFE